MIGEKTSPPRNEKERKPPQDPRLEDNEEKPEQEQASHPLQSEGPELVRDSHT
jgi:hypothetical protein